MAQKVSCLFSALPLSIGILDDKCRGLEYTSAALRRNLNDPNEELKTSFSKAYEATLQKYHNFLIKSVFHLAMNACPYRKDFYKKLSGGEGEDETIAKLKPWLAGLENCVSILVVFYRDGKHEW